MAKAVALNEGERHTLKDQMFSIIEDSINPRFAVAGGKKDQMNYRNFVDVTEDEIQAVDDPTASMTTVDEVGAEDDEIEPFEEEYQETSEAAQDFGFKQFLPTSKSEAGVGNNGAAVSSDNQVSDSGTVVYKGKKKLRASLILRVWSH